MPQIEKFEVALSPIGKKVAAALGRIYTDSLLSRSASLSTAFVETRAPPYGKTLWSAPSLSVPPDEG